ncbi:MAG: GIY-YIG nuclease family protein [Planctomycetota bacterium]
MAANETTPSDVCDNDLRTRAVILTRMTLEECLSQIRVNRSPFYVYGLCSDSETPFYVGKGTGTRVAMHESESSYTNYDLAKHREIRALWSQGKAVTYKLFGTFDDEHEAFAHERQLIRAFGRRDKGTGVLTNLSDGGEGKTREYGPEQWVVDAIGIVTAKEVEAPLADDLLAPRFRNDERIRQHDYARTIVAEEIAAPTGPEMQLLAFLQYGGLTVQVFYSGSPDLDGDVRVAREQHKWFGGSVERWNLGSSFAFSTANV